MTTLTTPRLLLRPLTMADLPDLHRAVWSDPAVTWDGVARTPAQSRDALRAKVEERERCGFGMSAAILRGSGELVGFGGLQHLEGSEDVELGYYLSRSSWGRGFGTEIAREVLRHAFEDLRLDRVVAVVRPENTGSRRVLAKVGLRFHHEGDHYGAHVEVWEARNPLPAAAADGPSRG
jgi:ribosomal-protein-alanine N-acetyltransferase